LRILECKEGKEALPEKEENMNIRKLSRRGFRVPLFALAGSLSLALFFSGAMPAAADEKMEATQLVEKAQMTLQSFMCDGNMGAFRDLLKKAEGVLIVPNLIKGAWIIGASGGSGVLLVKDKMTGGWSEPAFYTLGSVSLGLQIGGQSSEVILLAMSNRGVTSFLSNSLKLGADVGAAAGPVGLGASAATANLSADILSFARSKGLYGGISLDGAVVATREGLNAAYYGKKVSPADILIRHEARNPQSRDLTQTASRSIAKDAETLLGCVREGKLRERYGAVSPALRFPGI
jgi:lipid-binding SYLF domain-containing protein